MQFKKLKNMILKHLLFNRLLQIGAAALAIYALLGFLLIPWLISSYATNFAVEKLKRKASVAEVNVNPFFFTFEVKDFKFDEADGRPILGFKRLFVDFELSSLFRWAWTFADIQIETPSLYLEIRKKDRCLNLKALSDSFPGSNKAPTADGKSNPARLIVQHIEINDGVVSFSDQTVSNPVTKTFHSLNLEFKDISTLKDRKGSYAFTAMLPGGGRIGWQGEASLHPVFSEGELSLTGFDLSLPWEFIQDKLAVGKLKGEMDISAQYRFDYRNNMVGLVLKESKIKFNKLSLAEKGKNSSMLEMSAIEASGIQFDLKSRELLIGGLNIKKGSIEARINEKGELNWQKIFISRDSNKTAVLSEKNNSLKPDGDQWEIRVNGTAIEDVALNFTDNSRANPMSASIGAINFFLNASARAGKGPLNASLDGLKAKINAIAVSEAGKDNPLISLNAVVLDDGRIDLGLHSIKLAGLEAAGGKASLVRNKDGKIKLLELMSKGKKSKANNEVEKSNSDSKAKNSSWSYALDQFELKEFQAMLKDESFSPTIAYDLKDIHISLKNIANKSEKPIDLEAKFNISQGGRAAFNGKLSQTADYADAHAEIADLSLAPLQPLVNRFTYLELISGQVSASAGLTYRSAKPGPQTSAEGSLDVEGLRLNETGGNERFLEWKSLAADKIKLAISPAQLHIKDVKLTKPGAKIVVFKDRSVNLAKILRRQDKSAINNAIQSKPLSSSESSDEKKTDFPISIDRIRIEKGVVDFSDSSLVLPFATRVTDFTGKALKISSDPASRASLKFDGKVGDFGFSSVEGSLSAFAPKEFTDISVLFNNVQMTPLSPYSATFAGRKIASGTLNLKLEYKIKNSELLGNNTVVLDKFTLGEKVKAPGAVNLPLDLAIALLTDNKGKINMAVPVSGNVDNPKFQYGQLIRKAIFNMITRVVTSPFRALGGLFGGKAEQIDDIAFYPGKDQFHPQELKKLEKVAEALKKRPQLRLVVHGSFDPKADGEAMRIERVKRALFELIEGSLLSAEEEPEMIEFDDAGTQRSLEKQLETAGGKTAINDFKTKYEKSTGKKPEPVKSYMAIFGRGSSDAGYYQAMFEELVRIEPLNEKDLIDLAQRRSEAIIKAMINIKGLDKTRTTAGTPGPAEKASKEAVNTKLTLDVLKTTQN